jgi:iron complex transport system ATP-binding protein
VLRADNLSLGYPGRILIERLALDFRPGSVWAILGRNGSGKSTLLHALAGLAPASPGVVHLDGQPIASLPRRSLARRLGVLLQEESREFWGSVKDYVLLGRYPYANSLFGWSSEDLSITALNWKACIWPVAERPQPLRRRAPARPGRVAVRAASLPVPARRTAPALDLPHQVAVLNACPGWHRTRVQP